MSQFRRIISRFPSNAAPTAIRQVHSPSIVPFARPTLARRPSPALRSASLSVAVLTFLAAGCTLGNRDGAVVPEPSVTGEFAAFDGREGAPLTFAEVVTRCRAADVIFFGEEHNNRVCNELQWRLLAALSRAWPRTALAMEFFETDTQADLDLYLRGRIDETAFLERTRQGKGYAESHRPLIELCRREDIPVLAANAPRRLVREFRRSGEDYFRFRSALKPTEFRWLPRQFTYLSGEYRDRFMEITKGHPPVDAPAAGDAPTRLLSDDEKRERGFLAQLLWDNAMSESLADRRWTHPNERVMLIVGGFHIERGGATATIFRWRRAQDRVCTILYRSASSTDFDDDDRGAADIVLYGRSREDRPDIEPVTPAPAPAQPAQDESVLSPASESDLSEDPAPTSEGVTISTPLDSAPESSEPDANTAETSPPTDSSADGEPLLIPAADDAPDHAESVEHVTPPDTIRSLSDPEMLERSDEAPPLEPVDVSGGDGSHPPDRVPTPPPEEPPSSSDHRSGVPASQPERPQN